jgi:hypothetical protein
MTWRQRARQWHRWLGILAAAFVLLLAFTGVLLNHTHSLGLDQKHLRTKWVLGLYGIKSLDDLQGFAIGPHWLSAFGGKLYHDDASIIDFEGELLAAGAWGEFAFAISADQLVLLMPDGEVIESLNSGLPEGIRSAGVSAGRLVLGTDVANVAIDQDFGDWQPVETPPEWIRASALPSTLREALMDAYVGPGVTVERIVQDVHSGRILGGLGVFLMDLAALALVFLAASGIWLFRRPAPTR